MQSAIYAAYTHSYFRVSMSIEAGAYITAWSPTNSITRLPTEYFCLHRDLNRGPSGQVEDLSGD